MLTYTRTFIFLSFILDKTALDLLNCCFCQDTVIFTMALGPSSPAVEGDEEREMEIVNNISNHNYLTPVELGSINKGLSILTQNVRSLQKNSKKLNDLVITSQPDIAALQEVWHGIPEASNYDYISIERSTKRGGGVGFLIKKDIIHKEIAK